MALSPKTKRATDKQIAYANAISEFITGDKMFDKETSRYKIQKYIAENAKLYNERQNRKATEQQLLYANSISKLLELGNNFDEDDNFTDVSNFISEHKEEYDRKIEIIKVKSYLNSKGTSFSKTKEFMFDALYKKSGLYAFLNELDEVVYIGKSINLLDRIPSSYRERCRYSNISKIMYYVDDNIANVNILELLLISEYEPVLNTDCKTEHKCTLFSSGIDIKTDFVELEEFVFAESEVQL